ncbi:hypothetical protein JCM11641_002601 [Rhodosporidiobolus odoratus]
MSLHPASEESERKPSKSPLGRPAQLSLEPNRSRSRSRSTFSVEIPAVTGAQRLAAQRQSRSNSAVPPSSSRPNADLNSTASGDMATEDDKSAQQDEAPMKEKVVQILGALQMAGVQDEYQVLLEGGRRVRRSRAQLLADVPDLLAGFDLTKSASPASSGSNDSEVMVVRQLRGGKEPRHKRASRSVSRAKEQINAEMGEASEEGRDDGDESMDEPSSSSEDDGASDDDELDDDDVGLRRSSRSKAKRGKPAKDGARKSTRSGGQVQKHYDFGQGSATRRRRGDEDDHSSGSERRQTRSIRRSTRASTSSAASYDHRSGESSDELSIQAKPRASAKGRKSVAIESDVDDEGWDELESSETSSVLSLSRTKRDSGRERPQDLHRAVCAKCGEEPASDLLRKFSDRKNKKKPGRKRKRDVLEEDTDAEEDRLLKLGAWVECGVCYFSYHFGCLPLPQKRELTEKLKAEHQRKHEATHPTSDPPVEGEALPANSAKDLPKRKKLELEAHRSVLLPKCPACKKQGGRKCFECGVSGKTITKREIDESSGSTEKADDDDAMAEEGDAVNKTKETSTSGLHPGLMHRCTTCKRVAHYGCLENDEPEWSFEQHCQSYYDWAICGECYNFNVALDVILAWAEADPLPNGGNDKDDVESDDEVVERIVGERRVDEKTKKVYDIPSAKDPRANAKYLVKWQEMSYRHLQWVPHAWLMASYPAKLSNFLQRGSTVSFDTAKDDEPEDGADEDEDRDDLAPLPDADAMKRIPQAWRTVDRVLEVWYFHPKRPQDEVRHDDYERRYELPEQPDEALKLISQCKIKWGDLAYRECTDEAPPKPDEEGYTEFVSAYKAFLKARDPKMCVPALSKKLMAELDAPRDPARFKPLEAQPDYIPGKLMDFQIAGLNFLRYQWWQRTGCILADEMGLGKTCQIISFLSWLSSSEGARPFLVVVPNSLIGNWMREFAKWAPAMRVVPYNGDGESRKIVEDYELFDQRGSLKTHVALCTYEALQGNARVFRRVDRWDTLVVDEGQRLKSGKDSLLFQAINSLNIGSRVLLSGTPLNNNLREVFNLLAFINPSKYPDVDGLTERFTKLTPALVEEVREMLKPRFLRRTKNLVLNLPPLTDVVVPVSMTVVQRRIYRGILERNASVIQSLVQKGGPTAKKSKKSSANILMELRKTLCHPYIIDSDIEPRTASVEQAHINLTEASAKLVLLQRMLPKLKAAGHRVLIFSQFKLTLNIVERFLGGMKLKYLRLDGDTPQAERQRDVDKYNASGSEYFAYLLSTRAGGVGLNITSADVVIIYDQDFNPQQDLQAISRAHRIGQTKPVRVFKLLVKGTCEEKIFNAGNKKLGLEHLIIQRIDAKNESEDVESMLQFGAIAVFDEAAAEAAAIRYTDNDIDDLLKKTADPSAQETEAAGSFAQAQVWVREKGGLDDAATLDKEIADKPEEQKDLHDFWSQVVDRQQEAEKQNKLAQAANAGRGKRRRARVNYQVDGLSPKKLEKKKKNSTTPSVESGLSSGDEYRQRKDDVESDDEWAEPMDVDDLPLATEDSLQAPPPLARTLPMPTDASGDPLPSVLQPANPPPPKARKKQPSHTPVDTTDAVLLAALEELRRENDSTATRVVNALVQSAVQSGHTRVLGLLTIARNEKQRTRQTELVERAANMLHVHSIALRNGPLNPLPAVSNAVYYPPVIPAAASSSQGASSSRVAKVPVPHDPVLAVPIIPVPPVPSIPIVPVPPVPSAPILSRPAASIPVKPKKRKTTFPAASSVSSTAPLIPLPPVPARLSVSAVPPVASSSVASLPIRPSPPPSANAPKKVPSDAPAPPSAPNRTDSGGPRADGSSGGRSTPQLKQGTLNFGKKPSQPVASSSTSTPRAVPAKRPSPTASTSAPEAKRPTPPSSSSSVLKKPTPTQATTNKKEPIVIDLISGSEED